jgi:hypothetical protein
MAEEKKAYVAAEESQPNSAENKRGRHDERELDSHCGGQPSRQGDIQTSGQGKRKRARQNGRKADMGSKMPGRKDQVPTLSVEEETLAVIPETKTVSREKDCRACIQNEEMRERVHSMIDSF